jgi:hypothetical protein
MSIKPDLADIIGDVDYSNAILDMPAQSLEPDNLEDSVSEGLPENGKCDFQSATWLRIEIDENKMDAVRKVIREIENSRDELPNELIDGAKTILEISSGFSVNDSTLPSCSYNQSFSFSG